MFTLCDCDNLTSSYTSHCKQKTNRSWKSHSVNGPWVMLDWFKLNSANPLILIQNPGKKEFIFFTFCTLWTFFSYKSPLLNETTSSMEFSPQSPRNTRLPTLPRPCAQARKHASEGIYPCFETQGRRHQKSKKEGYQRPHKKDLCPTKIFKKKKKKKKHCQLCFSCAIKILQVQWSIYP